MMIGIGIAVPMSAGVAGSTRLAEWIFADGTWSDSGKWQDFRNWSATGLFINSQYWDAGSWSDAAVW